MGQGWQARRAEGLGAVRVGAWSGAAPELLAGGWDDSRGRAGSLTWVLAGGGAELLVDGGVLLELRSDVAAV